MTSTPSCDRDRARRRARRVAERVTLESAGASTRVSAVSGTAMFDHQYIGIVSVVRVDDAHAHEQDRRAVGQVGVDLERRRARMRSHSYIRSTGVPSGPSTRPAKSGAQVNGRVADRCRCSTPPRR